MAIKVTRRLNEPLPDFEGDLAPRMKPLRAVSLSAMVRTRLDVEQALSACGNDDRSKTFLFTAPRRTVLLAMLAEQDSPFSASLRADAAMAAGTLDDKRFVAPLRRLALDEREDLETRVNAVGSWLRLAGARAARDLPALFASRNPIVRRAAYLGAFGSPARQCVAAAQKRFPREKDPRVRSAVARRVPSLQGGTTRPAR
jgi:hypothetical protein